MIRRRPSPLSIFFLEEFVGKSYVYVENKESKVAATLTDEAEECELPEGSVWTNIFPSGGSPPPSEFQIAIYDKNDIVSSSLRGGRWELSTSDVFGPPGHMMDIGANVGAYTFNLAKRGWNVTAFEPMKTNLAMMNATLCKNPLLKDKINLNPYGLGATNEICTMRMPEGNVGDGVTECASIEREIAKTRSDLAVSNTFESKRLDDIFDDLPFVKDQQKVDFLKIDIEGYECQALKGATKLLNQKPRLVQSEIWMDDLVGCTPEEFLDLFISHGYEINTDISCNVKLGEVRGLKDGIIDIWACQHGRVTTTGAAGLGGDPSGFIQSIEATHWRHTEHSEVPTHRVRQITFFTLNEEAEGIKPSPVQKQIDSAV